MSRALHLDVFKQPAKNHFFTSGLLKNAPLLRETGFAKTFRTQRPGTACKLHPQ
jgi:hypothetical protein